MIAIDDDRARAVVEAMVGEDGSSLDVEIVDIVEVPAPEPPQTH
jgi:hypothetical protein